MTPKEQKLEDKFPRTNEWGTKVMNPHCEQPENPSFLTKFRHAQIRLSEFSNFATFEGLDRHDTETHGETYFSREILP